jgi:hypothetical protein
MSPGRVQQRLGQNLREVPIMMLAVEITELNFKGVITSLHNLKYVRIFGEELIV